jgi:LmbE family N-acetylglucosaminyl deacetylase
VFDISRFVDVKVEALNAYSSQFHSNPRNSGRIEQIRREALYWGDQVGAAAAEPFACRETLRVQEASALFAL